MNEFWAWVFTSRELDTEGAAPSARNKNHFSENFPQTIFLIKFSR